MLFADLDLARRIEATDVRAATEYAHEMARLRPDSAAAAVSIAGGAAVYSGVGSPVTQAMGLGLNGPVSEEEFDTLESFFRGRGCRVEIEVCPLADESLLGLLGWRGYTVFEWSNVLIQPISAQESTPPLPAGVQIRRAGSEDADAVAGILASCFLGQDQVTPEARDLFAPSLRGSFGAWFVGAVDGESRAARVCSCMEEWRCWPGPPRFRPIAAEAFRMHFREGVSSTRRPSAATWLSS